MVIPLPMSPYSFRSVGVLIAHDQIENVSRQVRQSDQPVVIADANGRLLLTNGAFERLIRPGHPHLTRLEDLPRFFAEPVDFRTNISRIAEGRPRWRLRRARTFHI